MYIRKTDYIKEYFKDEGYKILHREDGPAIEQHSGTKEWWINGLRHREDGPAIEWYNGVKYWYLHGIYYPNIKSNEYWIKFTKSVILL